MIVKKEGYARKRKKRRKSFQKLKYIEKSERMREKEF